jgi:hypothetical protein
MNPAASERRSTSNRKVRQKCLSAHESTLRSCGIRTQLSADGIEILPSTASQNGDNSQRAQRQCSNRALRCNLWTMPIWVFI